MKIKNIIVCLFVLVAFATCKKKFDEPAKTSAPPATPLFTIDSIFQRYKNYYIPSGPAPTKLYRFGKGPGGFDLVLECTVTADESSGNLYKTVYVEDSTGGLQISLLNSGALYVGDKIRINLNNVVLNDYGDVVQLDSIDSQKQVFKISSGNNVTPKKITFNEITASKGYGGIFKYQSRLIMLDTVEFAANAKCQTFADAVNKATKEINLLNNNGGGGSVVVRNSGYANFASSLVPGGTGSVVAILTQFGSTPQLTLRDANDVKLSAGFCPLIVKTFDDGSLTSNNGSTNLWMNYNVSGSINWTTDTYNGQTYGRISNYVSGNQPCETWLISPSFDISSGAPYFVFQSAYNYSGPALQVYVLSNYSGGDPNAAITQTLSPTLSAGSWNWAQSGKVSLNTGSNKRIGFKYTGTSTAGSTWEIDDIAVFGN